MDQCSAFGRHQLSIDPVTQQLQAIVWGEKTESSGLYELARGP